MTHQPTGPACGNNPNARLTDGDRQAVAEFRAYLADRAALRDRIAGALYERERPPRDPHWPKAFAADREVFEAMADAVLAVLAPTVDRAKWDALCREAGRLRKAWGEMRDRAERIEAEVQQLTVDRAAVLLEAADAVFALDYDVMVGEVGDENFGSMREAWDVGTIHATELLRRLAAETQQQETPSMRLAAASIRASITEAAEAGPEDVLEDAVALLREAATLYDAREQPESAALRIRVLSETLARLSGTRSEDSATEEIGAAQVRAVFREMLAEMDQRAGTQRQPDTETEGAACTCGRTACESDLCDCDATPCPEHGFHRHSLKQPGTETPAEGTGAALARYIADRPLSEIQAAIRILGWPPLRFEVVEEQAAVPVQPAAADTDKETRRG